MPHLREGGPQCDVARQPGHRRHLAPGSPPPLDVPRQRARHPENEVAHPNVPGADQPPRCPTRSNRPPQITLAHIGRYDVRRETNGKPTPPTQPAFSRCDHPDEHRHVRPPFAVIEPEQARRQDSQRLSPQPAQVCGMAPLDSPRSPSPGRPLNPGGDEQNEQPRVGERSARDAAKDYVLGLELHNRDSIATSVVSSVLGLTLALSPRARSIWKPF